MPPRVSIITPSYNQAAFLEQTIQSVLEQGYPDLEYIIVDGASTDGSIEIISKYAPYLTWWVSEPDQGQAEAINKGLQRASGEIIAWLNSDDYYLPGALQAAVASMQANPAWGLVYGDVLAVGETSQPLNLLRYQSWKLEDLMCFNIIGQPAVFMRREALAQSGLLDSRFHYLLDHQLWLRIAMQTQIQYVPQLWAAARFHLKAKNVAQAAAFGKDAYEIVAWMQTQPELAERFKIHQRRIHAGAHRINARYLSEGRKPRQAIKAYFQCLLADPPTALKDWRRLLLTLFALMGIHWLRPFYLRLRKNWMPLAVNKE